MSRYLLDTNACIALLRNDEPITQLARQGKPIGPCDLQIAAIARAHGLIVVTHNTREFARVPGLMLEDWQIELPIGEKN